MQFKEGDTVSVFEGTHEGVRADRSMQIHWEGGRIRHSEGYVEGTNPNPNPNSNPYPYPNLNPNTNPKCTLNFKVRNVMRAAKGKPSLVAERFMKKCRTFEVSPFSNEDRLNLRTVSEYTRKRLERKVDERHG